MCLSQSAQVQYRCSQTWESAVLIATLHRESGAQIVAVATGREGIRPTARTSQQGKGQTSEKYAGEFADSRSRPHSHMAAGLLAPRRPHRRAVRRNRSVRERLVIARTRPASDEDARLGKTPALRSLAATCASRTHSTRAPPRPPSSITRTSARRGTADDGGQHRGVPCRLRPTVTFVAQPNCSDCDRNGPDGRAAGQHKLRHPPGHATRLQPPLQQPNTKSPDPP